jgi:hypothetical protein
MGIDKVTGTTCTTQMTTTSILHLQKGVNRRTYNTGVRDTLFGTAFL